MTHFLARLLEPLLRSLLPARGRRRRGSAAPPPCVRAYPYSCRYVGGPTAYRRGEAPLRGEDSPLVRPYLDRVETDA
ncbi:hypothetical protein D9753_22855 [Streptomyces dangxiongensis]|uniref:Uncharacterized protein n=1 Tax=Streptomyces dangxiongensis TaxID=1442032 RepID=A0A3G2JI23_9ACTN|nr:hypothetical protein [Streptomyces dangxiongensis]AYN41251.1 hypothetical protein D9753_22855 [Streptomyces dangxiongensis]